MPEQFPAFTSIGSYPIVYLDSKDRCLCSECAKERAKEGTAPKGDVFWEGEPIECEECGKELPSAYGPVTG